MIEPSLQHTIGLTFVLNALQPATPWGRERKAALRPFLPEERSAQLDALQAVKDAGTLDAEPLRAILARFREIRGTVAALSRGALGEAELFDLKRFLLNAAALYEELIRQNAPARFLLPDPSAALSVLDPDGRRDPAFSAARGDAALAGILLRKANASFGTPDYLALLDEEQNALARALAALSDALAPFSGTLRALTNRIGALDFALASAALAKQYGGVMPAAGGTELTLTGLKNPAIPGFQPLDFTFCPGVTALTGANMGGKSTALATVALNVTIFRMGLFPFAEEARIPWFSDVFLIAGDASAPGLSEFAAQMKRLNAALSCAGSPVLLLVDELARGTNPEEGAAIVAAVTEYLGEMPAYSVLTTHFSGVAERAGRHYRALGRMPEPGEAVDYRFTPVSGSMAPPRDAIRVLSRIGVPEQIVLRAKELC